ncbi:MAG: prepilin-type N-terminal cleavage/methylation domain-containing protein [Deferribacteraceae bacterium]|jgi:prepilin-type N-terminal cleavage/methylation domain-containing protein|nr:prepilin-type N-terminal cleavage/methylation domain-containing protein [Deferribacteraceae bacterium]
MRKIRGFSLVELTIVLIIVGIIIAMFMGGISFMEKARIKTELGKLTKFSSAMTTYYTQNAAVPKTIDASWGPMPISQVYEPTDFEDFGLTREDFRSSYQVNKKDASYLISSCWLRYTGNSPDRRFYYEDNATEVAAGNFSHTVCIYFDQFYARFICNLEKSIDDKLTYRSDGLSWDDKEVDGAENDSFDNVSCDAIGDNATNYAYKIFQY